MRLCHSGCCGGCRGHDQRQRHPDGTLSGARGVRPDRHAPGIPARTTAAPARCPARSAATGGRRSVQRPIHRRTGTGTPRPRCRHDSGTGTVPCSIGCDGAGAPSSTSATRRGYCGRGRARSWLRPSPTAAPCAAGSPATGPALCPAPAPPGEDEHALRARTNGLPPCVNSCRRPPGGR
jgi:hypothetical protein